MEDVSSHFPAENFESHDLDEILRRDDELGDQEEVVYAVPEKPQLDVKSIEIELNNWLDWLQKMEQQLLEREVPGGLPETVQEQLEQFLVLKSEIDGNINTIDDLLEQAASLLSAQDNAQNSAYSNTYLLTREKWDKVLDLSAGKKQRLEMALEQATNLNDAMGDTADWLIEAEEGLAQLEKVIIKLGKALRQKKLIQEHCEDKDAFRIRRNLGSLKTHFKNLARETHETVEVISTVIDRALNQPECESDEEHCTPL